MVAEPASAKLYVILGSHACRAGMLMLEHKGIAYRRVTIPAGLHPMYVRLRGFPASGAPRRVGDRRRSASLALFDRLGTVPALRFDGERVQTNREIARFLDRVRPEPRLFPTDPVQRKAVEVAESWGDEALQMFARRVTLCGALHGRDGLIDRGGSGKLGPVLWRNDTVRWLGALATARGVFHINEAAERDLLDAAPEILDRVDAWIDAGLLNGEQLNAADFQIAPSLALFYYRAELRPQIEGRPAAELVDRLLPG